MGIDRRDFLKVATAGAGLAITGTSAGAQEPSAGSQRAALVRSGQAPDVVVIGAGNFGNRHPNCPSYNFSGVTGWPALPGDSRGFRIRTGGHSDDAPDTSIRWVDAESHARPREILAKYFPALAERAINETRACHYTLTVSRNFIIDEHPDYDNGRLSGGGSAESFQQGPVLGEYIAGRIMGTENDHELDDSFRLLEEEFSEDEGRGR